MLQQNIFSQTFNHANKVSKQGVFHHKPSYSFGSSSTTASCFQQAIKQNQTLGFGKQQQQVYREKLDILPSPFSQKSEIDQLFDSAGQSTCDNSLEPRKKDTSQHEDVDVSTFDIDEQDCCVDSSSTHDDTKSDQHSHDESHGKKQCKSHASSRDSSESRSITYEEREHSSGIALSDQQHSDLDVSSEDLTDTAHQVMRKDKLLFPKSVVEEPSSIYMKKQNSEEGPQMQLKGLDTFQPLSGHLHDGPVVAQSISDCFANLKLSNNFTPSTPHVHKFRTEMCKTFEIYGTCKYGDRCSFAHTKTNIMVKTQVSSNYKTKLCKKFASKGYCPYGVRCQFIHDPSESQAVEHQKVTPHQHTHTHTHTHTHAQPVEMYRRKEETSPTRSNHDQSTDDTDSVEDRSVSSDAEVEVKQTPKIEDEVQPQEPSKPQTSYKDILVHNVFVSVQEHQKKMKVFQKRGGKRLEGMGVPPPRMEYMNIYTKPVKRLGCFQTITGDTGFENEKEYTGNAQSYEKHLDRLVRQHQNANPTEYQSQYSYKGQSQSHNSQAYGNHYYQVAEPQGPLMVQSQPVDFKVSSVISQLVRAYQP